MRERNNTVKMEKVREYFSNMSAIEVMILISIAGILTAGSIPQFSKRYRDKLYAKASTLVDENRDGVTSRDEWKEAYKRLGIHYDELNPSPLKSKDLRRLIKSYDLRR